MSVVVTRPDDNLLQDGPTVAGANTLVEALSDDTDSSWVAFHHTDRLFLGFAEPTIPAGAKVKMGRVRARAKKSASGDALVFDWNMHDRSGAAVTNMFGSKNDVAIPSTTATTYTVLNDENTEPHVTPTNIQVEIYSHGTSSSPSVLVFALYFDTIYVAKPVVTVLAPTGTITGDTTPTVSWANSLDPDGGGQTAFEVKFFKVSEYGAGGFDPDTSSSGNESGVVVSGSQSWASTELLIDGVWRAYVRVAQTVNGESFWSDWAYSQFTMSINRPAVPGLTVTAEPTLARIKVQLTSVAGAATTSKFQTEFSDDGTNWYALRTSEDGGLSTPSGGAATEYDYEAPNGGVRSYRARALHAYPEGYAVSAWSDPEATSWTSTTWWVKNVNDPAFNVEVVPKSQPTSNRTGNVGLFRPLGAKYPIAVADQRSSVSGELVFRLDSDDLRDSFAAMTQSGGVVLIQAPAGVTDWPDRYCALGDYGRERAIDKPDGEYTFDSVQWTEVVRP
jgi:hypothetical protein